MQTGPELLTTDEAAQVLRVHPVTLAAWRSTGKHELPFVRLGKAVRYRREDIDAWLRGRRETCIRRVPATS